VHEYKGKKLYLELKDYQPLPMDSATFTCTAAAAGCIPHILKEGAGSAEPIIILCVALIYL